MTLDEFAEYLRRLPPDPRDVPIARDDDDDDCAGLCGEWGDE